MRDFSKYLTFGDDDKNWGIYLNVAGSYLAPPNMPYPSTSHPSGYFFNWEQGRVLKEFQLNYITEGSGILENEFGKFPVKPGSLIVTFPDVWHRYKPLTKTGWREHYIGFNGPIASQFMLYPLFSPERPVMHVGIKEELIDTYYKIFDFVHSEKPGFQQIASGMIIKLLGYLISFEKQKEFSGKRIADIIEDVRFKMRQNVESQLQPELMAKDHCIGYSYFRKMFKKYTGVSPHQYHLELKIMRARELLLTTDKSIKEISFELGFQSIHYFSRLFKNKVGQNPSELRNKSN